MSKKIYMAYKSSRSTLVKKHVFVTLARNITQDLQVLKSMEFCKAGIGTQRVPIKTALTANLLALAGTNGGMSADVVVALHTFLPVGQFLQLVFQKGVGIEEMRW